MAMDFIKYILNDYTFQTVALGAVLLGIISGVLGSFAVLRKQSLLGDAISHSALPGIAIAFIITQTKNTEILLLGALVAGLLSTIIIISIDKYSRIKFDSLLALILSVFFGIGLVLLTYIQKIPNANQAGLEKFIFGQASTLLKRDINLMIIVGSILFVLLILFWKEFKIVSFDPEFADSIGISVQKITLLLSFMIVLAIIIGLQTVGVILMSAMLVAPGVAARQWTNKLSIMLVLAGFFGAFSGLTGSLISSSIEKMPTGPSIVLIVSLIVIISIAFSPNRGLVWKQLRSLKVQRDITTDQILISLYELAMNHRDKSHSHSIKNIKPSVVNSNKGLRKVELQLYKLMKKELVNKDNIGKWNITEEGIEHIENNLMKGVNNYVSSN
jgi:manganese/zinc/iron transport system permease protein